MERIKACRLVWLVMLPLFASCSTVPLVRVERPWIRTLQSSEPIQHDAKLKIEVEGSTLPLLGKEELVEDTIRNKISALLKRRGFVIDDASYDYKVRLNYKSERSDKLKFSSAFASANLDRLSESTSSSAANALGLGVAFASSISELSSAQTAVARQAVEQSVSYIHTISIDIFNRNDVVVWKGDTTWDSQNLNFVNDIIPALHLILSYLPTDQAVKPEVPEIKNSHVVNYYMIVCVNTWFTCPALPYRIYLKTDPGQFITNYVPSNIKEQYALAAYVDLIQTAEYALPDGDEDDWKNPLDINLWNHVTLGGQYLLGPNKKPVNVIIKLYGQKEGYYLDSCRVVSDNEYSDFKQKLLKWRKALSDYVDCYAH